MGRMAAQIPNNNPQRLTRVLDAKWRTIGVDTGALQSQVSDKEHRKQAEKAEQERFSNHTLTLTKALTVAQAEADAAARQQLVEQDKFRKNRQTLAHGRDWDLSRPDALRLDQPARVGDNDPRLGVSSAQVFDGEDLQAASRRLAQGQQSHGWWAQQSSELLNKYAQEANLDRAWAQASSNLDQLTNNLSAAERESLRKQALNKDAANAELAAQKGEREKQALIASKQAAEMELNAALRDPFLNEHPEQAISMLGPNRIRKDHWKGASPYQQAASKAALVAQLLDNKARRQREIEEQKQQAAEEKRTYQELCRAQRQGDIAVKMQQAMLQENLRYQQAEMQKKKKEMDELYKNHISPDFHNAFGQSHR